MVHRIVSHPRSSALVDACPPPARRRIVLTACALALLVSGCESLDGPAASDSGRPFDDAYVAQIKKGVTTKADIRKNIGEPWQTTTTAGNDSWTYHYSDAYANAYKRSASFGIYRKDPIYKMLVISFSGDKVADYSYTK